MNKGIQHTAHHYIIIIHTYGSFMKYLRIQIQVCKLSITDGCHCLTVHCEVHLSTIAFDGDIVPV